MKEKEQFGKTVWRIALPVTAQSLLSSSFSVIDQIMIGQLGENSIAGIGLGGKFVSLYSVVLAAIAAAAGIMISQYMGKKDERLVGRSFWINTAASIALGLLFLVLCLVFPEKIMAAYTKDEPVRVLAAGYIRILAVSFVPVAVSSVVTTMLRCMEAASLPLYASMSALLLNTVLNYLLIFGKWIFPEMGVEGAAVASAASQIISCLVMILFFIRCKRRKGIRLHIRWQRGEKIDLKQYLGILGPLLICEFLWSLGENVYTAIYGNIGTDACAAMTMTVPVQTVVIGALGGLSQAAGIVIGKTLGAKEYERAYEESKKLMKYGLLISVSLSLGLLILNPFYVKAYQVEPAVQEMTRHLLLAIAVIAPVKVMNMILGGGIIRSGGRTKYVMWIDIIGTWVFGVPLGFLAAFVWHLPIAYVYFVLSLEECVRLGISWVVFRRRNWMGSLQ